MKPIKSLLVVASMLVPAVAAAQPGGYYAQPASTSLPGGFHNRMGRLAWGFSIGLGGMHDAGSQVASCSNCGDYNPIAFEVDGHIGGFLGPRFALMAEFQTNGKTVQLNSDEGDLIVSQNALMIAGQYWISPQLWVKGGIGFSHMQADDYYFTYDLDNGIAVMGAVGFEVFSARDLAVDIQGRLIQGGYHGLDDKVTSGTVGVGINWY